MITYNAPDQLDSLSWLCSGTTDQTLPCLLRFYLDGVKVDEYTSTTSAWSRIVPVAVGESPTLEVLDKASAIPSPAFSAHVTLNWLAVTNAKYYRVEEYVSAAWVQRVMIKADSRTAYKWRTRYLEESTTFQFRVTPIDSAGNTVTALTYSFLVVRAPDVPNVNMAYSNSTHKVTISAA